MRGEVHHKDRIDDDAAPLQYEDFLAFLPKHEYIFIATREMWPAKSVDARLPMRGNLKPSAWLDENRAVMQLTWAPGEPQLIQNKVIDNGGFTDKDGSRIFNSYRAPPDPKAWSGGDVTPWLDHIEKLYGDGTAHIVHWCAHRVQHPNVKINHALVLGGEQGIGKDTILEPVKRAVGPWNCESISAEQAMHPNNKFVRSVLLVINEARDLGEHDRFAFYDHLKVYIAAPPDVLRVNEKYIGEYYVPNLCGVIITTNHKTDGIYLDQGDRRHFVAWSDRVKEEFETSETIAGLRQSTGCHDPQKKTYWQIMRHWYDHGGAEAVAHYLATINLDCFDPKMPSPKTEAFYAIVNANRSTEDAELADLLDDMEAARKANGKHLDVVTLKQMIAKAQTSGGTHDSIADWLCDRANRRRIPHRMDKCGFTPVRNPDRPDDGLWKIGDKRQTVYGRKELTEQQRQDAARQL